ncbi:putative porin [Prevotella sp. UBA5379]|nr:putative porin [Prevotella sp. UBA5379]
MRKFFLMLFLICAVIPISAQINSNNNSIQGIDANGDVSNTNKRNRTDSLGSEKEIPRGIHVWTVDERFGDRTPAQVDTLSYMYMNTTFTTGLRGEYNTLGNMGSPRIARIFIDRPDPSQFIFTQPYDYFVRPVGVQHFTNTYSPITNVTLNECGNRIDGEDDFKALYAVNAGKRLGVGFRFDYKYGRGYYSNQSTSHFGYTTWASYIGDQYQAHLLISLNHEKVAENGGITNDNYITHPETFNENYETDEIPTVLEENWNRNDNQHIFFTHRYSLGFSRKVPMTAEEIKARKFAIASKKENDAAKNKEKEEKKAKDEGRHFDQKTYEKNQKELTNGRPESAKIEGNEPAAIPKGKNPGDRIAVNGKASADSLLAKNGKAPEDTSWTKSEYVPVTSFIHTMKFDSYHRIYQAYQTPDNYYLNSYPANERYNVGDSIYDSTRHFEFKNTFAIALLEGFNKYAKAGLKAFASYDLRHFELPDSTGGGRATYNERTLSIGGQLSKTQGSLLHYNVTAELGIVGQDAQNLLLDGNADLNFKLFGDTVQLAANAFLHRTNPTFYFRHYHSRHFWWDNTNLDKIIHSRLMGDFTIRKTQTKLRVAYDNLQNYTYFMQDYNIVHSGDTYSRTGNTVSVKQKGGNMSLLTVQLFQNFEYQIFHWENVLTFQKSSDDNALPVPTLNVYTNLYLRFRIARVLHTDLGIDMRYFTSYYAPDYSPAMGVFTVQDSQNSQRVKIGNYPMVNAYINFDLKHTRFFVMYSHLNGKSGNKDYFYTPHYPLDPAIVRFGISWNFFN